MRSKQDYFCDCNFDLKVRYFLFSRYEICNNRKISRAFSYKNPELHEEFVTFLTWFMGFYGSMKLHVNQKNALKPTQEGVLLSTTSLLYLQKKLLDAGYDFVLTGRFSNDGIENYHSLIRFKDKVIN